MHLKRCNVSHSKGHTAKHAQHIPFQSYIGPRRQSTPHVAHRLVLRKYRLFNTINRAPRHSKYALLPFSPTS